MSDATALGAVTVVFAALLRAATAVVDVSREVTIGVPTEPTADADRGRVNLFLFDSRPTPSLRNEDLPYRSRSGPVSRQPRLPLDLRYLLTFRGASSEQLPERLLGATLGLIHRQPVLTRDRIDAAIKDVEVTDADSYVLGADLASQLERIQLTPLTLTIEEISNLWSTLQTPYALSLAVQVSVVILEPDVDVPAGPPVLERGVFVVPGLQPVVESVEPQLVNWEPDARLVVHGQNLGGEGMFLEIGKRRREAVAAGSDRLRCGLPEGLPAGVHSLRVIRTRRMGDPLRPRDVGRSNPAVVVVRPVVGAVSLSTTSPPNLSVQVTPPVLAGQRASVLALAADAPADVVPDSAQFRVDVPTVTSTMEVEPVELSSGTHLIRVRVDGAESALELADDGTLTGPTVTAP